MTTEVKDKKTETMPTLVDVEKAAYVIISKADALENRVMSLEIHDEKDLADVNEVKTTLLKPLLKAAEDERAMFSTTLRRMATAWDAKFKPGIDKLKGLMAYADQLIIDYVRAQEKAAREKQAILDAEAAEKQKKIDDAGLTSQIPEALPELARKVETSYKTQSGGRVAVTKRRDISIIDEALIPRSYLVPDLVRIKKDMLGGIEIPGVEIVYIDGIRST